MSTLTSFISRNSDASYPYSLIRINVFCTVVHSTIAHFIVYIKKKNYHFFNDTFLVLDKTLDSKDVNNKHPLGLKRLGAKEK